MGTRKLSNAKWKKLKAFFEEYEGVYTGKKDDLRQFLDAVLWIMRTGSPWRDLPEEYGQWNSIYKRFTRWRDRGIWEALFEAFRDDPDVEYLMVDSTVVRAHPGAAGASKKKADKTRKP